MMERIKGNGKDVFVLLCTKCNIIKSIQRLEMTMSITAMPDMYIHVNTQAFCCVCDQQLK
jgi:hypothetical protein